MNMLTTKKEIEAWLNQYNIVGYTLNPDPQYGFTVSVEGEVNLAHKNLEFLPVQFKKVGNFSVNNNYLKTLKGCPETVVNHFACAHNRLSTLEGGPIQVGGNYQCFDNCLTSLKFSPREIYDNFNCSGNELTTLEGGPIKVLWSYNCGQNKLITLKGAPQKVRSFNASDNCLENLQYCPEEINGFFYIRRNRLKSLDYLPQIVEGDFSIIDNPKVKKYQDNSFTELLILNEKKKLSRLIDKKEKTILKSTVLKI